MNSIFDLWNIQTIGSTQDNPNNPTSSSQHLYAHVLHEINKDLEIKEENMQRESFGITLFNHSDYEKTGNEISNIIRSEHEAYFKPNELQEREGLSNLQAAITKFNADENNREILNPINYIFSAFKILISFFTGGLGYIYFFQQRVDNSTLHLVEKNGRFTLKQSGIYNTLFSRKRGSYTIDSILDSEIGSSSRKIVNVGVGELAVVENNDNSINILRPGYHVLQSHNVNLNTFKKIKLSTDETVRLGENCIFLKVNNGELAVIRDNSQKQYILGEGSYVLPKAYFSVVTTGTNPLTKAGMRAAAERRGDSTDIHHGIIPLGDAKDGNSRAQWAIVTVENDEYCAMCDAKGHWHALNPGRYTVDLNKWPLDKIKIKSKQTNGHIENNVDCEGINFVTIAENDYGIVLDIEEGSWKILDKGVHILSDKKFSDITIIPRDHNSQDIIDVAPKNNANGAGFYFVSFQNDKVGAVYNKQTGEWVDLEAKGTYLLEKSIYNKPEVIRRTDKQVSFKGGTWVLPEPNEVACFQKTVNNEKNEDNIHIVSSQKYMNAEYKFLRFISKAFKTEDFADEISTSEGLNITVKSSLQYHIDDPQAYLLKDRDTNEKCDKDYVGNLLKNITSAKCMNFTQDQFLGNDEASSQIVEVVDKHSTGNVFGDTSQRETHTLYASKEEVTNEIMKELRTKLKQVGIELDSFTITSIDVDEEIKAKQQANIAKKLERTAAIIQQDTDGELQVKKQKIENQVNLSKQQAAIDQQQKENELLLAKKESELQVQQKELQLKSQQFEQEYKQKERLIEQNNQANTQEASLFQQYPEYRSFRSQCKQLDIAESLTSMQVPHTVVCGGNGVDLKKSMLQLAMLKFSENKIDSSSSSSRIRARSNSLPVKI